jgi:hypothetical protein
MNRSALNEKKRAAIEVVLAKAPSPANDALKNEIRSLANHGDAEHEKVALYRLLELLANFPS